MISDKLPKWNICNNKYWWINYDISISFEHHTTCVPARVFFYVSFESLEFEIPNNYHVLKEFFNIKILKIVFGYKADRLQ